MNTMQAAMIVAEARRWLGTPYHHAADVFGVGVDCAMLPVRVYCDLGLVPTFDPRPYPHDWMLHRSDERYLGWVEQFAGRVERPQAGDLALFQFGRCFSHGGIVETPEIMIHAWARAGKVERTEIASFAGRPHGFWRLKA